LLKSHSQPLKTIYTPMIGVKIDGLRDRAELVSDGLQTPGFYGDGLKDPLVLDLHRIENRSIGIDPYKIRLGR